MAIKKKSDKVDRLFENFASEKIIIVLDKDIELTLDNEEGHQTHKTPVTATGFLTDIDEEYVYLGHTPNGIHQAIRKEYIVHIEIDTSTDTDDDIMDIGELPKGIRGYN